MWCYAVHVVLKSIVHYTAYQDGCCVTKSDVGNEATSRGLWSGPLNLSLPNHKVQVVLVTHEPVGGGANVVHGRGRVKAEMEDARGGRMGVALPTHQQESRQGWRRYARSVGREFSNVIC